MTDWREELAEELQQERLERQRESQRAAHWNSNDPDYVEVEDEEL